MRSSPTPLQSLSCSNEQDNSRPQVARVCRDFQANSNIVPVDWPSFRADLSQRSICGTIWRQHPPTTHAQLRNALVDEWNNISIRTVNALVNSIQSRIRAAAAARGEGAHEILISAFFVGSSPLPPPFLHIVYFIFFFGFTRYV